MELVDLSIPLKPHKLCVEKSVNPLFEAWQIRGGYKTYIISRRLRRIRYKNIFLNCYVGGNPLVISCDGLWKESEGSIFFPINLLDRIQTVIRLNYKEYNDERFDFKHFEKIKGYDFLELALPEVGTRRIQVEEEPQNCETICHIRPCHFTAPMFTLDDVIVIKNYTEGLVKYLLPRKIYNLFYK